VTDIAQCMMTAT